MVHAVPSIPWSCPSKRREGCRPPSSRPSRVSMCIYLQTFHVAWLATSHHLLLLHRKPWYPFHTSGVRVPRTHVQRGETDGPSCPGVLMSQVWTMTFVSLREARPPNLKRKETGSPRGNGRDAPGSCRVAHGARHEGGALHVSHFVCLNQAGGGTDRFTSGLDGSWLIDTVTAVRFEDPGQRPRVVWKEGVQQGGKRTGNRTRRGRKTTEVVATGHVRQVTSFRKVPDRLQTRQGGIRQQQQRERI